MKTLRMTILSLSALIIFLSSTQAFAGSSDFRIRAKVRTPYGNVVVRSGDRCGNESRAYYRTHVRHRLHVSKQDRRIAGRLAGYFEVSKYKMLEMRDRGYRWSEIARYLDLPRRVVRAAHSAKSWRKFLRPVRRCGTYVR